MWFFRFIIGLFVKLKNIPEGSKLIYGLSIDTRYSVCPLI